MHYSPTLAHIIICYDLSLFGVMTSFIMANLLFSSA